MTSHEKTRICKATKLVALISLLFVGHSNAETELPPLDVLNLPSVGSRRLLEEVIGEGAEIGETTGEGAETGEATGEGSETGETTGEGSEACICPN